MEKYRILETIGKGSFGEVTKAQNMETGEIVAIKKMKQKFATWEECMSLRELKPLRKLQHKNIVKLKEVLRVHNELSFVFEHVEQDIYKLYEAHKKAGKRLSESLIRSIFFQLAQSLSYMHKHGYFHRDLKPENILFSGPAVVAAAQLNESSANEGVLKLIDFGLAREIRSRPPYTEYVATRWYRAPELLLHSNNYNSPVDIFALGCIIAELFMFKPLFNGSSELDQLTKICSILGTPPRSEWQEGYRLASVRGVNFPSFPQLSLSQVIGNDAPPEAIQLITECLRWDPSKRPTAAKILQHSYFHRVEEVLPRNYFQDLEESTKPSSLQQSQQQSQSQSQQQQPSSRQTNYNQNEPASTFTKSNNNNNDEFNGGGTDTQKPPLPFSLRSSNQQNLQSERTRQQRESAIGNYADFLTENTRTSNIPVGNNNNTHQTHHASLFDENKKDYFTSNNFPSNPQQPLHNQTDASITGISSQYSNNTQPFGLTSQSQRSRVRLPPSGEEKDKQNANVGNGYAIHSMANNNNNNLNDILGTMMNVKNSSGPSSTSFSGLPHPRSFQSVSSASTDKRNNGFVDSSTFGLGVGLQNGGSTSNAIQTDSLGLRPQRNLNSAMHISEDRNYFANQNNLNNGMPSGATVPVSSMLNQNRNYYSNYAAGAGSTTSASNLPSALPPYQQASIYGLANAPTNQYQNSGASSSIGRTYNTSNSNLNGGVPVGAGSIGGSGYSSFGKSTQLQANSSSTTSNSHQYAMNEAHKPSLYDFNHVRQPMRSLGLPASFAAKY